MFFNPRCKHEAIIDAPDTVSTLRILLEEALCGIARLEHAFTTLLKGQHHLSSTFADLKAEIDTNISNQNAFIDAAAAYQTAANDLITKIQAGEDVQGAIDELKAQDATLAAKTQAITAPVGSLGQTVASVAGAVSGLPTTDPTTIVHSAPVDGTSSATGSTAADGSTGTTADGSANAANGDTPPATV